MTHDETDRISSLEAGMDFLTEEVKYIRGKVDDIAISVATSAGAKAGRAPYLQWFITIGTVVVVSLVTSLVAGTISFGHAMMDAAQKVK